jgi:hypothetical protein
MIEEGVASELGGSGSAAAVGATRAQRRAKEARAREILFEMATITCPIPRVAKKNMAGRPGKYGLPTIKPSSWEMARKSASELKQLGTPEALAELERRKASRALRVGMEVPARVAKRKPK